MIKFYLEDENGILEGPILGSMVVDGKQRYVICSEGPFGRVTVISQKPLQKLISVNDPGKNKEKTENDK